MRKSLSRSLIALFCGGVLTTPVTAIYGRANPAMTTEIMRYELFSGGFHIADAEIRLAAADGGYRIALGAWTRGFVRSFYPWQGSWYAEGALKRGRASPTRFDYAYAARDKYRWLTISWDREGVPTVEGDPLAEPGSERYIPENLRSNTMDPLSAVFSQLAAVAAPAASDTQADGCIMATMPAQTLAVYDGRRRFEMQLSALDQTGRQTGDIVPLAGYRERSREFYAGDADNPEPLFKVNVAGCTATGIPVISRIEIRQTFGNFVAKLRERRISNTFDPFDISYKIINEVN